LLVDLFRFLILTGRNVRWTLEEEEEEDEEEEEEEEERFSSPKSHGE